MAQLDPRRLETFRVVALAGQISAAARQLHLSQPAVTAQIRQLEEEAGRPLFVRSARGVRLAPSGRTLLEHARRLETVLEEAAQAVRRPVRAGPLELGASTTLAAYVLPPLLAGFLRAEGGLTVRLEVGNTAQVLEWVRTAKLSLGVVEGHPRASGVRLVRFLDDELVPVVGSRAGPKLRGLERAAALAAVPLLWREPGSGTWAVVERALRPYLGGRRRGRRDLQLGSTEAIKAAAAEGLGVAFLSRWSIRAELESGALRVLGLEGLAVPRAFSWVLPAAEPGGMAERFVRYAQAEAPSLRSRVVAARARGSGPGEVRA